MWRSLRWCMAALTLSARPRYFTLDIADPEVLSFGRSRITPSIPLSSASFVPSPALTVGKPGTGGV
jgi:hypothetical protein